MAYSVIQPPFALKFHEMSKKELEAYRKWFHEITPGRIVELAREVQGTPGFESWKPDLTPDSLGVLGDWFERQTEVRLRTSEEIQKIESRLMFPIEVSREELTNRTLSLSMDIGMYFGQVVLKNLSGVAWEQPLKNKRLADYGQPVLVGFGAMSLNPVRVAVVLARSLASKEQRGSRLRELYETWARMSHS